ncbi:hypothetical protein MKX01_040757, partial [Papaver californicum]
FKLKIFASKEFLSGCWCYLSQMSSMPPNKEWMNAHRMPPKYIEGVASFIKFTKDNLGENGVYHYPYRECLNYKHKEIPLKDIHRHLLENRVDKSYHIWIHHRDCLQLQAMFPALVKFLIHLLVIFFVKYVVEKWSICQ